MFTIFLITIAPTICMIRAASAHLDAQLVRPQLFDVVVLDVEHHEEQDERQGDQDDAGQPAFRRQGLTWPRMRKRSRMT